MSDWAEKFVAVEPTTGFWMAYDETQGWEIEEGKRFFTKEAAMEFVKQYAAEMLGT